MSKEIKVLFAPSNMASMPNLTIQALNKLPGIKAKGISYGISHYWTFGPNWKIIEVTSFKVNALKRIFQFITFKYELFKGILWADILMWTWDIDRFEFFLIKLFKKKIFIEWLGSDIRVPDILFQHNLYYKNAWANGDWDYMSESQLRSDTIQEKFYKLKATPLLCIEMSLFLNRNFFPNYVSFFQRIDINNYLPQYPSPHSNNPVLVHTPSATGTKGTRYVREIVEKFRAKGMQFEYIEIHNKSRQEALDAIGKADIFIDQFIGGSYGLATCEALAMGKPVFCYLMPYVAERLPKECAIINSNLENLESNLERYMLDANLRHEAGVKSRAFAAQYHDADKIALQLQTLYKETMK